MRLREGQRDFGGHDRVVAGDLVDEGSVACESGHRPARRLPREERLSKHLVDEPAVVA
jgi:hypothetical protein